MRRWVMNVLTILSLTIALAAAGGYGINSERYDGACVVIANDCWEIGSFRHRVDFRLTFECGGVPEFLPVRAWLDTWPQPISFTSGPKGERKQWGFLWDVGTWMGDRTTDKGPYLQLGVPYWFIAVLAAILPARWGWRAWRRNRATAEGCCRVCGYDLRATPDRCPECGTVPPQPAPATTS